MSDNTQSAVLDVKPQKRGKANSAAAAPVAAASAKTGRTGRPPLLLKGGKPYKGAIAEAKESVRVAKLNVKTASDEHKNREKILKGDVANTTKAEKALTAANVGLAKAPKDAAAKQAVAEAKNWLKACQVAQKAAAKDVAAQAKMVEKANAALAKANEGVAKVEAAKAALLN